MSKCAGFMLVCAPIKKTYKEQFLRISENIEEDSIKIHIFHISKENLHTVMLYNPSYNSSTSIPKLDIF